VERKNYREQEFETLRTEFGSRKTYEFTPNQAELYVYLFH